MHQEFHPGWCLEHQRVEDRTSWLGPVCPLCKARMYSRPPRGTCRSYWESQPVACSLTTREPMFVYTLVWTDFRIRTLHAPETDEDFRSQNRTSAVRMDR